MKAERQADRAADRATDRPTDHSDRPTEHKDDRKTEHTSPHTPSHAKIEKTEREKTEHDQADDAETAMETDARDAAQAVRTPDAAGEKPRAHASLDGDATDAAPVDADATSDAAALQAAGQMGLATQPQNHQPQNQKTQAALAALAGTGAAASKDIAPMDAAADNKTNGVQTSPQPSEQRSDPAPTMPGDKPVALNGQEQGQAQDQAPQDGDKSQAGAQADAKSADTKSTDTNFVDAKPADTKSAAADAKDTGLKPLLDTARAEMMPDAAPQPQAAAPTTNMAASGLVRLDANVPAQTATPAAPQQVQVTTQAGAAPDLPRLAVDITARSQGGAKQFDIRLDPPELGRVEVRLSIDHDGKTSAHLTAEQPRTLDLLQRDSVLLARALRDAGLDVSQDSLNFSLRQQAHEGGHNLAGQQGQNQGRGSRGLSLAASRSIEATATSAAWRAPSDGRLDIRV